MKDAQSFDQLLSACSELATFFPDGVAFIGGIAVYIHAKNNEATEALAETTHDADLYISMQDMIDLRDIEEVVANRRLSKHQMIKHGFEFDIYTERHANLRVPYEEVIAHAQNYDLFKVASLEHLLVLKMEAYKDRKGTLKGEKDARDILRIAVLLKDPSHVFQHDLVAPYWDKEEVEELKAIVKGSAPISLAEGNAHAARALRRAGEDIVVALERVILAPPPPRLR